MNVVIWQKSISTPNVFDGIVYVLIDHENQWSGPILRKNVGNNKELGNNCYLDSELSKKEYQNWASTIVYVY